MLSISHLVLAGNLHAVLLSSSDLSFKSLSTVVKSSFFLSYLPSRDKKKFKSSISLSLELKCKSSLQYLSSYSFFESIIFFIESLAKVLVTKKSKLIKKLTLFKVLVCSFYYPAILMILSITSLEVTFSLV